MCAGTPDYRVFRVVTVHQHPLTRRATPGSAGAPNWVHDLVGSSGEELVDGVRICRSDQFCLLSLSRGDASGGNGAALERLSAEAYQTLGHHLGDSAGWYPVRIWNFVPGILEAAGESLNRYMRFNAGRYHAFEEWFGGSGGFDRVLPTASAVGHRGPDLVIHVLACHQPGAAVDNPRQLRPHRYSRRFGPLPPCFARATSVPAPSGDRWLLVGGTSSVKGEESVHVGDLPGQIAETFENLAALVQNAFGPTQRPLHRYHALRVYHTNPSHVTAVRKTILDSFPPGIPVEWVEADLCRADLMVEVEGVAAEIR